MTPWMNASRCTLIVALCACNAVSAPKNDDALDDDSGSNGDADVPTQGDGPPLDTGADIETVTDVSTALPLLPTLTNVSGVVIDDSVQVTFDPVDNARDYRIYPLPADDDISNVDGTITVHNAIYRCAGDIQSPAANSDDGVNATAYGIAQSPNVAPTKISSNVGNYGRTTDEATLGYVYAIAGDGRVPVWALGSPQAHADSTYVSLWGGWQASRVKTYTSVQATHDALVAEGYRDDGIAFYVPSAPSDATVPVYTASDFSDSNDRYYSVLYFTSEAERAAQSAMHPTATDFVLLKTQMEGTQPLKRVYYEPYNAAAHDELVVGQARFDQVYHQGNYPMTSLTWSGISEPTTLVIEALSSGCPYQGLLSADHVDSVTSCGVISAPQGSCSSGYGELTHEAYSTIEDLRATSATDGEVFINGQFDVTTSPQAIARAFIRVAPQTPPDMDFYDGFHADQTFGDFSALVAIANPAINESGYTMSNDVYDIEILNIEAVSYAPYKPLFTVGTFLGQLWLNYADTAADVQAKFRLEPKAAATLAADSFLHVTMTVDSVSTRRRYPHILITDQPHFVQETMADGHTVVVTPILTWPSTLQIQFCDHVAWNANAQCNYYELFHSEDTTENAALPLPPVVHVPQRASMDRSNQYDVYMSTSAVYLYFDGTPYGCAYLPADRFQAGPASVAFGDTLYHSGADLVAAPNGSNVEWIYEFSSRHLPYDTHRRFENVGYSSGVDAPAWDTSILPCRSVLQNSIQ